MPSTKSTEQVESPKLSAVEQKVHDAMMRPRTPEQIAATRTLPGPPNGEPYNAQKATQAAVDNLNRKTAAL